MQNPCPGANAAPKAFQFVFFVWAVDAVIVQRETCQDYIHTQLLFQFCRYGNRSATTDENGWMPPLRGECIASLGKRLRFDREADSAPGAMLGKFHLAVGWNAASHEISKSGADRMRILVEYQTEGYLGRRRGWDDGLEACSLIASTHAVDLAGRTRPDHFQNRASFFTGGH